MTEELVEQEIADEQAFVDRVHRQLADAGPRPQQLAREGHDRGRLGHEGGLVERDAMVFQAAKRIAQLDAAHEGLVFGRLDLRPEVDTDRATSAGSACATRTATPCSIDWRAPAAAVFYQATAAEPQNVVRRRVLRSQGTTVVSVEDELLDAEGNVDDLPILGEGALMAQLSRARDRTMHSIVATIQAEQDQAIRAPSRGVITISGGPGIGKTVVALHRAAYLLYTDRRRYETGGVLVVGPERRVHALHRAGAAEPRRDRRRAALAGRGRRRRPRHAARRAGRGRRQGLGTDGRADAADGAPAGAGQPGRVPAVLVRRHAGARPRRARPRCAAR